MLDTYGRKYADRFIDPAAKLFEKLHFKPTHVTVLALVLGEAAALMHVFALPVAVPVIVLWISGYLDAVDGALARRTNSSTKVGTLLDIFFDRVVELSFIIAFAFRAPDALFALLLSVCSIVLSMTVFLTSGNLLENSGIKSFRYQSGLMERTEGFLLFTVMIIFTAYMKYIAYVYAALILFTAIQRLISTISELKDKK